MLRVATRLRVNISEITLRDFADRRRWFIFPRLLIVVVVGVSTAVSVLTLPSGQSCCVLTAIPLIKTQEIPPAALSRSANGCDLGIGEVLHLLSIFWRNVKTFLGKGVMFFIRETCSLRCEARSPGGGRDTSTLPPAVLP